MLLQPKAVSRGIWHTDYIGQLLGQRDAHNLNPSICAAKAPICDWPAILPNLLDLKRLFRG
jgi:hypothetical protein